MHSPPWARAMLALASAAAAWSAAAHDITSAPSKDKRLRAEWDVVQARAAIDGRHLVFDMQVSGRAGKSRPAKSGQLAGSRVFSYVWPTSLDPSAVGFEQKAGILAFAVTAHPDFDDTPLFDENGDGEADNDGNVWHSHWVVLVRDDACGKDALKVKDIPEGTAPKLPATWPGLPLHIDSPGYSPSLKGQRVRVKVPLAAVGAVEGMQFDAVTAALRVNASVHAPLLCVTDVFKIASGDLSLPGKVTPKK
ncbi:MAG: hypothetical protein AB1430_03785 [Pseudomonadota bacterium]